MKSPKGKLVAIGGNEAKEPRSKLPESQNQKIDFNNGVLKEVINEMKGNKPIIEVLPIASESPKDVGKTYQDAFKRLGHNINILQFENKEDADKEENLERLQKADGIFLTGGDQSKIKEKLGGTKFLDLLKERYQNEDFVIAGTSSGAMVLSDYMIRAGESNESVLKGTIDLEKGLGFVPNVVIDSHFLSRGRLSRLIEALLKQKDYICIGICEDTALVITEGNTLKTIGSGTVLIIEGDINNTNYNNIKYQQPFFVENLKMHVLAKGAGYTLKEKKFLTF